MEIKKKISSKREKKMNVAKKDINNIFFIDNFSIKFFFKVIKKIIEKNRIEKELSIPFI
jgi:hypothetical protein